MKNLLLIVVFYCLTLQIPIFAQCTGPGGCTTINSTCANIPGPTTITSGTSAVYDVFCISPPAGCGNITIGDFVLDQYSTVRICTNSPTDTVKFIGQFRASGGGGAATNDNTRRLEVQGNVQMTYGGTITFNSRIVITVGAAGTLDLRPNPSGPNPVLLSNSDSIKIDGKLLSNGPVTFNGPVSIGSTGSVDIASITVASGILNNGSINSKQNITLSSGSNVINNGNVTSTGNFTSSAGSFFANKNYWYAGGNTTFSGSYSNNDYFVTNGTLTLNASGTLNVQGGVFEADNLILNAGTLNTGTGCAAFKIHTYTSVQNGSGISTVPAGTVGIYDMNNPGSIDNVACGCGSTDADGIDNAISLPTGTQCSVSAAPNSTGPYCGIIPLSSMGSGGACFATLPVKFVSVSVKGNPEYNIVKWMVEETESNVHYEVQYSSDGKSFDKAGVVNPFRGQEIHSYSFTHSVHTLDGMYYRIKQVDKDGKLSYSKTVFSESVTPNSIYIYPNPANDILTIYSNSKLNSVDILTSSGQLVRSWDMKEEMALDISKLNDGIYFVRANFTNGIQYSKLIVQ
jgi:adhesin HecA-like repeat protein